MQTQKSQYSTLHTKKKTFVYALDNCRHVINQSEDFHLGLKQDKTRLFFTGYTVNYIKTVAVWAFDFKNTLTTVISQHLAVWKCSKTTWPLRI